MGNNKNTTTVSLTVADHILEEWEEDAERMNMSTRAEYLRYHIEAGRKELSRLQPSSAGNEETLQDSVLEVIPEDRAVEPDSIVEEIVEPLKEEILNEILPELDNVDEIEYVPAERGYKKK